MIQNISWGAPHHSFVLGISLIAICIACYRTHKVKRTITLLTGHRMSPLIQHFSLFRTIVKGICMALGLLLLSAALLRPQGKELENKVTQQGRSVYFALDISRSMLAQDIHPTRLTRAKEKIKKMTTHLVCESVGLIVFSEAACTQCPLTTDISTFTAFLDQVDVETVSAGSTSLDKAINTTLDAFEHMPHQKNKLLIILTDGEDFSNSLALVKKRAQDAHLHLFALGIGSPEGAPIPLFDPLGNSLGHQKDENGAIVISQLNEPMLRSLAHDIGGEYIRSTTDDTDIAILAKHIQSFEKESLDDAIIKRFEEYFPFCSLAALICFILEWFL